MTPPYESAQLLLRLYEIRQENTLREARQWFAFRFHPATATDVLKLWLGPGDASAPYRMVTSYWDMAASLVTNGAIDAAMFHAANTEHFALIAKLGPFLAEIRDVSSVPSYLVHVERLVRSAPDCAERLAEFRRFLARQAAFAAERPKSEAGKRKAKPRRAR